MGRLYYVWTAGHGGATGEAPSGPIRQDPVLAESAGDALAKVSPKLTSWDGRVMKVTTDDEYAPRQRWEW